MTERKSLSNKVRFEVFKRDNFTCQYCGSKAPDVVLNVDHIQPVSKGGDNDILNLITSCFECNNGKKDKLLSDRTVINKQIDELTILNERKKQLEQLLQWKKELKEFKKDESKLLADYISDSLYCGINETGMRKLERWLQKYSFRELIDATDKAVDNYCDCTTDEIFNKIERIAYYTRNPAKPYIRNAGYIKGILRNRNLYYNDRDCNDLLKRWYEEVDSEQYQEVIDEAVKAKSWTKFRQAVESMIEGEYE